MNKILLTLFVSSLAHAGGSKKAPATEANPACESYYVKGVDDAVGALVQSFQKKTINTDHMQIIRQGISQDEVTACITCAKALAREGLKLIKRQEQK